VGSDFLNNNDALLKLLKQTPPLGSNSFASLNPTSSVAPSQEAQSNYFIENPASNPDFIGPTQIISSDDEQLVLSMLQTETEEYIHPFLIKDEEENGDETLEAVGAEQTTEVISAVQMYFDYVDEILQKYFPNMSEEELSQLSDADIERAMLVDSMMGNTSKLIEMIENYFNTEGIVDHGYNWIKNLLDLGLTKDDIIQYAQNEELKNQLLASALTNGSVKVIDNTQGLSDEELLAQGLISKEKINLIVQDKIANATSIEEVMSFCTTHLGLSEEDVIALMEEHYSQAETQRYLSTITRASQLDSQLGLKINIEITKGEDGKYYLSSDDPRSSFNSNYRSSYIPKEFVCHRMVPFEEYIKMNNYTSNNASKGQFSALAEKIAEKASLNEFNFDEMYLFLTGVEYNPETIAQLNEITPAYQHAMSKYVAAEQFETTFQSFDSPTQVIQYYQQMLGCSKEEAISAFNQYYAVNISKLNNGEGAYGPYGKCLSFSLSEDGKTLIEQYELPEEQYQILNSQGMLFGEYDKEKGIYTVSYSVEILDNSLQMNTSYLDYSIFKALNKDINRQNIISNQAIADYNESEYAEKFGAFEEITQEYPVLFEEAYGQNILNDKFAIYQNDMDTYASKIAGGVSMVGLGLSFFNPAFGIISLIGSFSDNGMDLLNLATNEVDGELGAWSKQFAQEAVAFAIGYGLGSMAGKFGDGVCAKILRGKAETSKLPVDELFKTAKTWGTTAEAVMDFGLSYPADILYEAMLTGEFNWEGNLLGNILGSAMDIRGGIGAYRAFKGGKTDFDYTFKDGTQVSYSKSGGLSITDTQGKVVRYGLDDIPSVPKMFDLITPENIFDPNDISGSYNRMMDLNYTNEEIESTLFNHLRTISEFDGIEDEILKRICQQQVSVSTLISIKDNQRALEIFNNLISNPKLKPLIDDYKISTADILDFTDLSDIELSHLNELLKNESIIKYFESFKKYTDERNMFDTIFSEDFKSLVQLPEDSFKNFMTLLENSTIARLLSEEKISMYDLGAVCEIETNIGKLLQLFEIDSIVKNVENGTYNLEELTLISRCNDRVFGIFLNLVSNGTIIAKDSFEYVRQVFDKIEPDIANKAIELYYGKFYKINPAAFELVGAQKISQHILDDINKIYNAYLNGQSIADAFVPKYNMLEVENAKVGEVFEYDGCDNPGLYIKSNNGTPVKLGISKETYLKLFPPINRYNLRQGRIGDCYLVATLYSMYENPATREFILQCFSENENGTVTVKIPNGVIEKEFSLDMPIEKSIADSYNKINRETNETELVVQNQYSPLIANAAKGYQMLEAAFGLELFQALVQKKFKTASQGQLKLLDVLSEKSIEYVLKKNRFMFTPGLMLSNSKNYSNTLRGNGGKATNLMSLFGITSEYISTASKSFIPSLYSLVGDENAVILLSSKDLVGDTMYLNKDLRIVGNHAYELKIEQDENGSPIYKLFNPHDTSKYTIITEEDIVKYFSWLRVGNRSK